MSTQRGSIGFRFTGKGECRWCGKPPPKGRRTWCSDACVEEFSIASWPAHARMRVEQRDHGVCAKCGRDCAALWTKLDALIHLVYSSEPATKRRGYRWWKLALRLGLSGGYSYCLRSLWDADHIVPVVEGGGGCGLDNLRTLCRPCHKEETRALARRRAEARRTAKEFA